MYLLYRLWGIGEEAVTHIDVACPILAQKEYKQARHDNEIFHWKLYGKWGFQKAAK